MNAQRPERREGEIDRRPVILLTGFGPFPGFPVNASATLVHAVAQRARTEFAHHRVVACVLPTEWQRAPERVALLHAVYHPVLALHFGVADGECGFRLETRADNVCRLADDAAGMRPISAGLADKSVPFREATIDVQAIVRRMRDLGHRVAISHDAGGYICNAVFFHSLAAAKGCACKVGFIHVPRDLSLPPFDMSGAVAGALEIMKCALDGRSAAVA